MKLLRSLIVVLLLTVSALPANKPSLGFVSDFIGDGVSTTLDLNLATDPILYLTGGNEFTPNLAPSLFLPTSVANVTGGPGISGTPTYNTANKTISMTFTSAPASGQRYTVTGDLVF